MGTIKRNDSRTCLGVKELISSARYNEDLGAKIKEQEERNRERERDGQDYNTRATKLLFLKPYSSYECVGVFIGLGFNAKRQLPLFYIT